ncbi:hypothetical protein QBC32DRAFT_29387 [Pseudoneurospora amorphoporcata]|uniref:Uncharacterized protein n=1 Tax=Pseudoneurospora amorphoporcata TaxID=241081 RepID=A0AAN6SIJ0_9PEZI|nr:hypothetical protein QBC32DRAFT_29387 [Pseudoneurospora amorphoporcata]
MLLDIKSTSQNGLVQKSWKTCCGHCWSCVTRARGEQQAATGPSMLLTDVRYKDVSTEPEETGGTSTEQWTEPALPCHSKAGVQGRRRTSTGGEPVTMAIVAAVGRVWCWLTGPEREIEDKRRRTQVSIFTCCLPACPLLCPGREGSVRCEHGDSAQLPSFRIHPCIPSIAGTRSDHMAVTGACCSDGVGCFEEMTERRRDELLGIHAGQVSARWQPKNRSCSN